MISGRDFSLAVEILHCLYRSDGQYNLRHRFSEEYAGQGVITTAVKVIHKAVTEGTVDQKRELSLHRNEIDSLNYLIDSKRLAARVCTIFALEIEDEANNLGRMQIALPQSSCAKMLSTVTRIPRVVLSVLSDILVLPIGGVLTLANLDFDPVEVKKGKMAILFLHGSGYNKSEWAIGHKVLNKAKYGSAFSLNYDGLLSNDPKKGVDDYATGRVRDKIRSIAALTEQNRVLLVGYSMGGLIASCYAERHSAEDGIVVEHVISISSPWRGSPLIDRFKSGPDAGKRFHHMTTHSEFRRNLCTEALRSERSGLRKYYDIGSTTDFIVPSPYSHLTEDPRRRRVFSYMGHYSVVAFPSVWSQITSWLDLIY